jgi:hypothetical protein
MSRTSLYDVFICHASEDKDTFVRPLADALSHRNIEVWYDEFSLKIGDSIRRALDHGLGSCRYGIVVLSSAFFQKNWPQYELDALVEREMVGGDPLLLPIWHGVDHTDVLAYSPALANKKAISSSLPLEQILTELIKVISPNGSPLLVARDTLLDRGLRPPVVTDPYWLKVVEASNRLMSFGAAIPEEATWGRWCFPLPPRDDGPEGWGDRLAWTAMQMAWSEAAEERGISPLTEPTQLLAFLREFPGLLEVCSEFPSLTAEWAPQLTIPGSGGELETVLEEEYQKNCREGVERARLSPRFGTDTTTDGRSPVCDETWALRDPEFGGYEPSYIANAYFGGQMFGPHPSPYEHADHLFWLLSVKSDWLTERVHVYLLRGHARWGVWVWHRYALGGENRGVWPTFGRLFEALSGKKKRSKSIRWTREIRDDVLHRAKQARETLALPETPDELTNRFCDSGIIAEYLDGESERVERRKRK